MKTEEGCETGDKTKAHEWEDAISSFEFIVEVLGLRKKVDSLRVVKPLKGIKGLYKRGFWGG